MSSLLFALMYIRDKDKVSKIITSLQLKISARDLRHTDPRVQLCAICSQWLPLAQAALQMVVRHLPSPLELSRERVEQLMSSSDHSFQSLPSSTQQLRDGMCWFDNMCCCDLNTQPSWHALVMSQDL